MIGRNPNRRSSLYTELKKLDASRTNVENKIDKVIREISYLEKRETLPKIYYPPLDEFFTVEEIEELDAFFNKTVQTRSTDLTSLFLSADNAY